MFGNIDSLAALNSYNTVPNTPINHQLGLARAFRRWRDLIHQGVNFILHCSGPAQDVGHVQPFQQPILDFSVVVEIFLQRVGGFAGRCSSSAISVSAFLGSQNQVNLLITGQLKAWSHSLRHFEFCFGRQIIFLLGCLVAAQACVGWFDGLEVCVS